MLLLCCVVLCCILCWRFWRLSILASAHFHLFLVHDQFEIHKCTFADDVCTSMCNSALHKSYMFWIDISFLWDVVLPFLKQMHYVVLEKCGGISSHVLPQTVWAKWSDANYSESLPTAALRGTHLTFLPVRSVNILQSLTGFKAVYQRRRIQKHHFLFLVY